MTLLFLTLISCLGEVPWGCLSVGLKALLLDRGACFTHLEFFFSRNTVSPEHAKNFETLKWAVFCGSVGSFSLRCGVSGTHPLMSRLVLSWGWQKSHLCDAASQLLGGRSHVRPTCCPCSEVRSPKGLLQPSLILSST